MREIKATQYLPKSWLLEPEFTRRMAEDIQRRYDEAVQDYLDGVPLRPDPIFATPQEPNRKARRRMSAERRTTMRETFSAGYISPLSGQPSDIPAAREGEFSAGYYIAEVLKGIQDSYLTAAIQPRVAVDHAGGK